MLEFVFFQVTLGYHSAKLSPRLQAVKRSSGLPRLVAFENAKIDLDPFVQIHPFETLKFLSAAIGSCPSISALAPLSYAASEGRGPICHVLFFYGIF